MVDIFIADDHAIVRDGLRALLQPFPSYQVIGEAADSQATLGARSSLASTTRAIHPLQSQNTTPPSKASAVVPQNSARRTRPRATSSSPVFFAAICRTPTVPTPSEATAAPVWIRFTYNPARPTPTGPSRTAATFILARLARMVTTCAPPMIDEDRRIAR